MNNKIYNRIRQIHTIGSKTDKKIANYLSEILYLEKTPVFTNITTLANAIDVSLSSVHRFVKMGGWLSFKHFYYDFINLENIYVPSIVIDDETSLEKKQTLLMEEIALNVKKPPYLFCSKKSNAVCNLLNKRIEDLGYDAKTFSGDHNEMIECIQKMTSEDVVVMITISGYSYLIFKLLDKIAKIHNNARPKIIFMTAGHSHEIVKKYNFIIDGFISKMYDEESWTDYNNAVSEIIKSIMILFNKCYEISHFKNEEDTE